MEVEADGHRVGIASVIFATAHAEALTKATQSGQPIEVKFVAKAKKIAAIKQTVGLYLETIRMHHTYRKATSQEGQYMIISAVAEL